MKILVVYGTTHGHTERIVARMAERMRAQGHDVLISSTRSWSSRPELLIRPPHPTQR